MSFQFSIPTAGENFPITVEAGSSLIFVGANGGGKTRLAVYIENSLGIVAHRISAHRALGLNPEVPKISEMHALNGLRTGVPGPDRQVSYRKGNRWRDKESIFLLNDFDFLIQALFADQNNISLQTHKANRAGNHTPANPTNFERLVEIWERLLPHRTLHITGDDIEVSVTGAPSRKYKASDMSDGERAIFYMIGQALTAAKDSLLIMDEPELHVHRSIMSKLWDELEAARPDCGFVFISHDLEFAASRVAQKFVLRDYDPAPKWIIEVVPENTGFDEQIATLILGSRRPVLFVEGEDTSLDIALYRCCYPDWTVIPRNSCEQVIHSVVTMRKNADLTRVTCSGIVDADDYADDERRYLESLGIAVLPVSEIENLFLLPDVSRVIAESEGYAGSELESRILALRQDILKTLTPAVIEYTQVQYCRRRIDRTLKKIDLSGAKNIADLSMEYGTRTAELVVADLAHEVQKRIKSVLSGGSLRELLAIFDGKGLISLAAKHLKGTKLAVFEAWLLRVLRNDSAPELVKAIRSNLPEIVPR